MFRKALTVLGSVAMVGATIGAASAAAYPAPFTSNTAIIVGANAAPSDSIAAASIAADLNAASVSTSMTQTTTVEGGDSYKFEKTSTKFHLGDAITDVVASDLGSDEMPMLLADGRYSDDNNDEFDYTQTITMDSATTLTQFTDNDYKEDTPTVGFRIPSGDTILTYTLTFNDEPLLADMETTDLTLMGKTYYVLNAATTTLTLLDSADSTIVAEGETSSMTAGGHTYSVSVEFVDSTTAKLKINGETTTKLAAGQTYRLSDGSYVGVKEVLYSAKDTGISKVEFSIGNGKLVLTNGTEVEMNDDSINGLTAFVTDDGTNLASVSLQWDAEDDLFVTKDSQITMPGFNAVQLAFGGLHFPSEEMIKVANKGDDAIVLDNFPMTAGESDIALLYSNATHFVGIGEDSDKLLLTDANADGNVTFDDSVHEYFVASYADGRDSESYLMRANNFKTSNSVDQVTFQYQKNGAWTDAKTDQESGDTFSVGSVEFAVGTVDNSANTVNFWITNTGTSNFNTLYSKEGLKVNLPFNATSGEGSINLMWTNASTSYDLVFHEEDQDGNLGDGPFINATIGLNSQSPKQVEVTSYTVGTTAAGAQEVDNSDVYSDFVYSALATEISNDKGPDQHTLTLTYHGEEATADVYITSSDTTFSGGQAGVMTYTDSEVSKADGMNLIVVGGSAINSVAAELLGGAYSEAAFTTATGVASGEFLIQSFDRSGKTALLVAGYNAADTTKAATYLVNNAVDTAVGNKYKGTSATEASLVVA